MAQAIATRNQTLHNETSISWDVNDLDSRHWQSAAIPNGEPIVAVNDRSYTPDKAHIPLGDTEHWVKIAIK